MKKLLLMIIILLFACPAFVWAQITDLVLDAQASAFSFSGKSSLRNFHGKAKKASGKLGLSSDGPLAAGEIVIPVLSLETGDSTMNRNMFFMFEPAAFPVIAFVIKTLDLSQVKEGEESKLIAHGVLSIHGVSRDTAVPVRVRLDHGRYVCEGDFFVSLKEHGLKAPSILFIRVADQVRVDFSAVFAPSSSVLKAL